MKRSREGLGQKYYTLRHILLGLPQTTTRQQQQKKKKIDMQQK